MGSLDEIIILILNTYIKIATKSDHNVRWNIAHLNLDHFVKMFYLTMCFRVKSDPYVLGSFFHVFVQNNGKTLQSLKCLFPLILCVGIVVFFCS